MSEAKQPFAEWIGKRETQAEIVSLAPALGVNAMLDIEDRPLTGGDPLPPLWHWFYFLPRVAQSRIGHDGHPQRGGFLPPVDLPRRMFAGARLRFEAPLIIGNPATREGEILDITEKSGRSGRLAFVTVRYRVLQEGRVCIEEKQDIVYREPGAPAMVPTPVEVLPAVPEASWTRTLTPDPVLLFRFSALTFNAHRIHYDRPYALNEEGYPGLVVHGPLVAVMLLDLVRRHSERRVTKFSFRGRAPLFDLHPFRLVGTPDEDGVDLQAQGPDGATTMTARAEFAR